jgi:hypothetical protein
MVEPLQTLVALLRSNKAGVRREVTTVLELARRVPAPFLPELKRLASIENHAAILDILIRRAAEH